MTGGQIISVLWISAVSLLTVFLTVYDKIAAKKRKQRIPENTLIFLGILGGAGAELAVMLLIRHKTRHKKFMAGLPVIFLVHCALFAAYYFAG